MRTTMIPYIARLQAGLLTASALLAATSLLFGCASSHNAEIKAAELHNQNTILQKANRRLTAELAEREALAAKLQMELVEKQAEIDRIASSREDLVLEAEYNKARMPAPATRVEAVAYLAEAETDIDTARELAGANTRQTFVQADRLIAESKAELGRDNYDKVSLLATQAIESIRAVRADSSLNGKVKKSAYADFAAPLRLQAAKESNIRKNPGRHADVLRSVAAGTTVTAVGYQGDWIKVLLKNGQTGWVYYALLTIPATTPPNPGPIK